jgi:CBS-domain-containing membrane protein
VFDVRLTSTLGYTIAKLVATRAHRVWIVDDKMYPIGVVSMTDVLSLFARDAGGKAEPTEKRHRSASVASTSSLNKNA